ncbi:MAG: hypothetical protein IPK78_20510 [Rhodospirillales bacterium]|nr:hypothetical protein [Rhodospirillales bacterium]
MIQPDGIDDLFKRLALERTAARDPGTKRRRVWAQNLYEEAVRELLDRLARGEKVVFVAAPLKRKERKMVWLDPALWTQVHEVSARHDVSTAAIVRTACLAYLEARGIKLEEQDAKPS